MALILKSNKIVNDVDNVFPYQTEFGIASKSLKDFMSNIKTAGYSINQTQFNALKSFENSCVELGVWNNIKEVMPLMGGTKDSVAVKYKGIHSLIMDGVNSPDETRVNSKGLTYPTYSGGPTSCYNSKFKLSDVIAIGGVGFISVFNALPTTTANFRNIISGTGKTSTEFVAQYIFANTSLFGQSVFNSSVAYPLSNLISTLITSANIISGNISNRFGFQNGVKVADSSSIVSFSTVGQDLNKELYVGANNNNGAVNQSFYGGIKFIIITDGGIAKSLIGQMNSIVNDLMVALNKY